MNVRLERKSDPPAPTNITCPWDTCVSNVHGWCSGVVKLVALNQEYYSKEDDSYYTEEHLVCANYEKRRTNDTR